MQVDERCSFSQAEIASRNEGWIVQLNGSTVSGRAVRRLIVACRAVRQDCQPRWWIR